MILKLFRKKDWLASHSSQEACVSFLSACMAGGWELAAKKFREKMGGKKENKLYDLNIIVACSDQTK